ncbi:MAG: response regulator [Elusimicrobia bacterium]|nr:response regulator [Elusimicrobiota bacterium]
MAGERLFIVEDETIVAEDLKRMLERMGYAVCGSAAEGDKALAAIERQKPDLVLMDIRIHGPEDGIEVAETIYARWDTPVIYLTAYADDLTVDRAKGTLASGYLLKPFEERGLKSTIDLALYRHKMERMVQGLEERPGGILDHLGVAVWAVDAKGNVTYLNRRGEALFGRSRNEALGRPLSTWASQEKPGDGKAPARWAILRDGRRTVLEGVSSPVVDGEGNDGGLATILWGAT